VPEPEPPALLLHELIETLDRARMSVRHRRQPVLHFVGQTTQVLEGLDHPPQIRLRHRFDRDERIRI